MRFPKLPSRALGLRAGVFAQAVYVSFALLIWLSATVFIAIHDPIVAACVFAAPPVLFSLWLMYIEIGIRADYSGAMVRCQECRQLALVDSICWKCTADHTRWHRAIRLHLRLRSRKWTLRERIIVLLRKLEKHTAIEKDGRDILAPFYRKRPKRDEPAESHGDLTPPSPPPSAKP